MLNTADYDDCCKPLERYRDVADMFDFFICDKCGCEWQPVMIGPLRHWRPVPAVLVFQAPGTLERES